MDADHLTKSVTPAIFTRACLQTFQSQT